MSTAFFGDVNARKNTILIIILNLSSFFSDGGKYNPEAQERE